FSHLGSGGVDKGVVIGHGFSKKILCSFGSCFPNATRISCISCQSSPLHGSPSVNSRFSTNSHTCLSRSRSKANLPMHAKHQPSGECEQLCPVGIFMLGSPFIPGFSQLLPCHSAA